MKKKSAKKNTKRKKRKSTSIVNVKEVWNKMMYFFGEIY